MPFTTPLEPSKAKQPQLPQLYVTICLMCLCCSFISIEQLSLVFLIIDSSTSYGGLRDSVWVLLRHSSIHTMLYTVL